MEIEQVARRGDLVVVATTSSYTFVHGGRRRIERYTVGVVTSVRRTGEVKAFRGPWGGVDEVDRLFEARVGWLVPQDAIDVKAAYAETCRRVYPGTSQPLPYDSLDEVRAALRPFLVKESATSADSSSKQT